MEYDENNPLNSARGCMWGLIFSIPVWIIIVLLALFLLGWWPW